MESKLLHIEHKNLYAPLFVCNPALSCLPEELPPLSAKSSLRYNSPLISTISGLNI